MEKGGQHVRATDLGASGRVLARYPTKRSSCLMPTTAGKDGKDSLVPSSRHGGQYRTLRALYMHSGRVQDRELEDPEANNPEAGARACLRKACLTHGVRLGSVPLEELELGDPGLLDAFYTADIAIADMSDVSRHPLLFYYLGIRESFNMTNNVILYYNTNVDIAVLLEEFVTRKNKVISGNYYFIPYVVTPRAEYFCCDNKVQNQASEYLQPNWYTILSPLCVPLVDKFYSLLMDIHSKSCIYFKQALLNDIQRSRGRYQGDDLVRELTRIKLRMDNMEVLTSEIIDSLLISYRDVQDYDSMIKLVENVAMSPVCDLSDQNIIRFHYAFALNRRNHGGDRLQALRVMLQILEYCEHPSPDLFCLCGRIYRDIFLESEYKDCESRDSAIVWYRQGFELEPSLYSGTNLAVLLIISGQHFESSVELRKIGVHLNSLLGKQGNLDKMNNYWDVGQFFKVTILISDVGKAVKAAERLFTLQPPVRYMKTLFQSLLLIRHFRKTVNEYSPKQEQLNFWLDILFESVNTVPNGLRFPVLVIEHTKVYQPSYVSINHEAEEKTITLWHVLPKEMKQIYEWNFTASSIRGVSIFKSDERCCFLYINDNVDDFQICFSTKEQCKRFCSLVRDMTAADNIVELEGDIDESIVEYEYELDASGQRIVLGKGTYGIVYAGRDLSKQVLIAIKEIPEKNSRLFPSLHVELALHKHLRHCNIVQYLGSVSEDGCIKIFMEQVPGGSLSALLQTVWGPIKEPTIKFYTRQILEGLKYLHENQIVHRDIKGDNILVNIYSGVVKISDFGTSKRLAGVTAYSGTFAGTLQYMAPEIIYQSQGRLSSGSPADIWSLGCTMIEMATGRPPFSDLGMPQAAVYKVGMLKCHPELPKSLSSEAQAFILSCFETTPNKRPTAAQLLKDKFLMQVKNTKKYQITFKQPGCTPPQDTLAEPDVERLNVEDQQIPSNLDTNAETFFDVASTSRRQEDDLASMTDDSLEKQNMTVHLNPQKSEPDLSLMGNDSDYRIILFRILRDEQDQLISILQEYLVENAEEPYLSVGCIEKIIRIMRDFVRSQDIKMLMSTVPQLRLDVDFDSEYIDQVHLVFFGFQDAVNRILKTRLIRPQWMYAMNNVIYQAVHASISVLIPELSPRTEPVSAAEDKVAEECLPAGLLESEDQGACGGTTNASGFSLEHPQETTFQLNEIRQETARSLAVAEENQRMAVPAQGDGETCQPVPSSPLICRLLKALKEKENEYQSLKQQRVGLKTQEMHQLHFRFSTCENPVFSHGSNEQRVEELVEWLHMQELDADTIETIVEEGLTLFDLLNNITKEDLRYIKLRGTAVYKLWTAISQYRRDVQGSLKEVNYSA
ncbi:mitogen-activated protein kinase kinase kinase 15 [Sorex fumeus]|uniref:mitogen-activated protein kinase kinase kinase 15 n=1 Tax=Sorex fumeus TaxID=62283 RepID=UPI0024AD390E|nr:mitogen-activated protein kinase kinase kinase 15 [Sorex fumeus]